MLLSYHPGTSFGLQKLAKLLALQYLILKNSFV